jgi:hypothetical protein
VEEFNKELRRRIWLEEHGGCLPRREVPGWEGVAPEPKVDVKARPPIDDATVWEFARGVPKVDWDFLRDRSPVDVRGLGAEEFLRTLYGPGEWVIVFTDWKSQGNFLFSPEKGSFRMSPDRGVRPVRSALPKGGPEGVWFLVQPVTGRWEISRASGKYSRRSEGNVTGWRYFVLESDVLDEGTWLRVVANLKLPIAAVYTSGGRSVHVLVRYKVDCKAAWDAVRNVLRQVVCPLGADPAALSAVRLSRLPGCMRGDRRQELLYLDGNPNSGEIWMKPRLRE